MSIFRNPNRERDEENIDFQKKEISWLLVEGINNCCYAKGVSKVIFFNY